MPGQLRSQYARLFCGGNFIGVANNWLSCLFPLPSERVEKQTRSDGVPRNTPPAFFSLSLDSAVHPFTLGTPGTQLHSHSS